MASHVAQSIPGPTNATTATIRITNHGASAHSFRTLVKAFASTGCIHRVFHTTPSNHALGVRLVRCQEVASVPRS